METSYHTAGQGLKLLGGAHRNRKRRKQELSAYSHNWKGSRTLWSEGRWPLPLEVAWIDGNSLREGGCRVRPGFRLAKERAATSRVGGAKPLSVPDARRLDGV